jgi:aminopeptidase
VADPRVERLADVLVRYSTEVGEGDVVLIDATPLAAPLVEAVYARVLDAGGHPQPRIRIDGIAETLLAHGTDAQLDWLNPARLQDYETADARIVVQSDYNTRSLSRVEAARHARHRRALEPLREVQFRRGATRELRWNVTLFPTTAAAQEAAMSLRDYEDFVYRAGLLDRDDPVAEWTAFGETLRGLAAWLGGKRELRVVADGTDLTLGVGGRKWLPAGGRENFPDGEVFTGPVETSVEGEISFTYPAPFDGMVVADVRLEFRGGEVVRATAGRGREALEAMLAMDEGARRAGEFAFGMNEAVTAFTGNTLFDEKIGGTVHLALGRSYPESGGVNRSALHWDLVCDLRSGSEVFADGELVYRNGRFLEDLF